MALSYVAALKIADSHTWTNGIWTYWGQTLSSGNGPYGTLSDILSDIKSFLEGTWGGTFDWTITVNGSFIDYDFTYNGLSTDPATDSASGYDLVALTLISTEGTAYSASFLSTTLCEDLGLCPQCPPSVNPDDATDCPDCYSDEVPFCDTPISILGLEDSTTYIFKITDQATGRIYTYTTDSDVNGQADLSTADFPTGLFTPYNGPFTISIFDTANNPVVLTYGYVNYSCVEVTITNSTDYTP